MTGRRAILHVPTHLIRGTLVAREPWRLRAACRNHPLWVPSTWDDNVGVGREDGKVREQRVAAAKAVCRGCPVRVECLRDVDWERDEGVRGAADLREVRSGKCADSAKWRGGFCPTCEEARIVRRLWEKRKRAAS